MSECLSADDVFERARACLEDGMVLGICSHSDDVRPGDIFIADDKGISYIGEALKKGAVLVLCKDSELSREAKNMHGDRIVVADEFYDVVEELLDRIYGDALSQVQVVGVTGTNGKSSTAYFSSGLLSGLGVRAGYIGTMGYGVYGEPFEKSRNTTPDSITTRRYIHDSYRQGCKVVVVEVSSHGIALDRISGIDFHAGIFTNLSRDHLDFHGTMEVYRSVKESFFFGDINRIAIINSDDPAGEGIVEYLVENGAQHVFSFGVKPGMPVSDKGCRCAELCSDGKGYDLKIESNGQIVDARLNVYGSYQIENAMAAICLCVAMGFSLDEIAQALPGLTPVPGRMELVAKIDRPDVYIDYAHTPDGIQTVLNDFEKDRSWCVFGCGGDRDKGKRPDMGRSSTSGSSHVVICDDNVRNESPEKIILDILGGIENKRSVTVCRDRAKAVCHAINNAGDDETVLLLGKGSEDASIYGRHRLAVQDLDIVKHCMESA